MIKYILSPWYKLIDLDTDLSKSNLGLQNSLDESVLSLNAEIGFFIQQYQTPQYFSDVVRQFALKYHASEPEVSPIILQFFETLTNRGILISEKEATHLAKMKFEPTSRVGENINGFILEKRLSFSMPIDIYLAYDSVGEKFLVKILAIPVNASKSDIRYYKLIFKNEFDILKLLSQNAEGIGICRLVFLNLDEGIGVTTFFENNGSLLRRVEDNPQKLKMKEKTNIFNQLVRILAFVHSKNVIHGDLHTSNILINDRGEVCLIDFDLAIQTDKKLNNDLAWGGAIEFIPPENINHNAFEKIETYPTLLSELFQLGVVGYFLFYDKLPFDGRNWTELAQAILQQNPNFESDTIPLSIQTFLKKILSKKPSERHVDLGLIQF
jgi:eukaryotic-like serine/threonine-protein kinase